jgi:hypothetical protein
VQVAQRHGIYLHLNKIRSTFTFKVNNMKNRILKILAGVAVLLLIPLIAMQFTDEVVWNGVDFLVAGGLLTGAGLTTSLLLDQLKKTGHKVAVVLVALATVLVLWAELAVGLFGSPLAGS